MKVGLCKTFTFLKNESEWSTINLNDAWTQGFVLINEFRMNRVPNDIHKKDCWNCYHYWISSDFDCLIDIEQINIERLNCTNMGL